jgi:hypothetical protein
LIAHSVAPRFHKPFPSDRASTTGLLDDTSQLCTPREGKAKEKICEEMRDRSAWKMSWTKERSGGAQRAISLRLVKAVFGGILASMYMIRAQVWTKWLGR